MDNNKKLISNLVSAPKNTYDFVNWFKNFFCWSVKYFFYYKVAGNFFTCKYNNYNNKSKKLCVIIILPYSSINNVKLEFNKNEV